MMLTIGKLDTLRWAAATGRFFFHKDTSCAMQPIREKLEAVKDLPNFKFFNAHAGTLLYSLEQGGAGFSGACDSHCNFFFFPIAI